ncbi:hypothetical protein HBA92_03125 [Ochrobactrum sp. MR28]|nr:hypothetical protein [Ochrobactrum sp. MR28]MBX8815512.1 hypothetical protein [Ochrobactrum sp. MR31]
MSALIDVKPVRELTRKALPNDNLYLYRLGVAAYGFASTTSFIIEIACLLDNSLTRETLSDKMAGRILSDFRQAINVAKVTFPSIEVPANNAADLFERLNSERSDFIHAYPITNENHEQILHRRKDKESKYYEITNDFLDNFIKELSDVSDYLYAVRDIIKNTSAP